MGDPSRNVWKRLSRLFPPDAEASETAGKLFREYESRGRLDHPIAELTALPLVVTADFFRRVGLMHSFESPVLRRRDTRWMGEFDYTAVNIRSAAPPGKTGNFLSAAMSLAALRVRGIVVAPVTKGAGEDLRRLRSHAVIRDELLHSEAAEAGIGAENQLSAFAEATHLLGFVLGYDLDYRVDPLAGVVLNRPDLFLWQRSDSAPPSDEGLQDEMREEVRRIVTASREKGKPPDTEVIAASLEAAGLKPVSSTDGSVRVPLSFHRGEQSREEAVTYWGRIFDMWRDRYHGDFILLRGTAREPDGSPAEAPDRDQIRQVADMARKGGVRRNVGVVVEGDGFEVEEYGLQGADLVVEDDRDAKVDRGWVEKTFRLDEKLRRVNLGRKLRFTVPVVVDPGDKDNRPKLERSHLKRFFARFLGTGPSRRPLWETQGALEGSWGYVDALQTAHALHPATDGETAAFASRIEEVAAHYTEILDTGERLDKHLGEHVAWWVIRSRRGLLIPIISVENEDLLPPAALRIDYGAYLKESRPLSILEYDFRSDRGGLTLATGTVIETGSIPYRGFRLYAVT